MPSPAVDLDEVPPRVGELVAQAERAGEVVLTSGGEPVARIIPVRVRAAARAPGSHRGVVIHMADDFDATPADFQDYV